MAISLYEGSVASYLQTLGAVSGFLDRGRSHFQDNNIDPEEIVDTRLFPDMHPFRFQIQSVVFHSIGAVEAIKSGVLNLPGERPSHDYAALQTLITDTRDSLRKRGLSGPRFEAAIHGRGISNVFLPAQFPFPRHHRLQRCA